MAWIASHFSCRCAEPGPPLTPPPSTPQCPPPQCDKAEAFLRQAVAELQRRGLAGERLAPPPVECAAIEDVSAALPQPRALRCMILRRRPASPAEGSKRRPCCSSCRRCRLDAARRPWLPQACCTPLHLPLTRPCLPVLLHPTQVRCLDPCTHAYSFWEGVPVEGKAAFGRLFAASRTMRSVAVVQRAIR